MAAKKKTKVMPYAEAVVTRAVDIQVERGKAYEKSGAGERSFQHAAEIYEAITGKECSAADIAMMLHCVKHARLQSSIDVGNLDALDDSTIDGINYLAFYSEEVVRDIK